MIAVMGFPVLNFFFRFILSVAITFLDFTYQLIAFTFDHRHVVVG